MSAKATTFLNFLALVPDDRKDRFLLIWDDSPASRKAAPRAIESWYADPEVSFDNRDRDYLLARLRASGGVQPGSRTAVARCCQE